MHRSVRVTSLLLIALSCLQYTLAQIAAPIKSPADTPAAAAESQKQVDLWGRWEKDFGKPAAGAPAEPLTVNLTSPNGKQHMATTFDDGGTLRVRFMPNEVGEWKYQSKDQLNQGSQTGKFTVTQSKSDNPLLRHGPLKVSADGTHLQHADGKPFFWLGDTVWTGPAMATLEDWKIFLADRKQKKFNVIQFNVVSPWRTAPTDRDGQVAFSGRENIEINPAFFARLDKYMDAINDAGMIAAPVLIWGLKPNDPGQYLPLADCEKLAKYQVARYGAHGVVWILAGDNPYKGEAAEKWKLAGRAVFGDRPHQPVTTHPTGMNWPWEGWRDEKWLDILGYQSGHGDDAKTLAWIHSGPVAKNWQAKPIRPIINLEPPYEDHIAYQSKKPHSAYSVRRASYWSVLSAPPAGLTYGAHGIWSWQTEVGKTPPDHPYTGVAKIWTEAKDLPGATDMQHLAEIFGSIEWWRLRPAANWLKDQPGSSDPAKFISAAASEDGKLAMFYLPVGGAVSLDSTQLPKPSHASWINPRTGERRTAEDSKQAIYTAPSDEDWLLLVEG